jgi:menaquinone-dependent protoporphyrinogen oxidase
MTVLVAYATCHGSTREVAERVGTQIALSGLDAEVRPVRDVQDVTVYEAAVLGSAIHGGKWLPEGSQFVRRFGPALRHRPVWLFSVSTVGDEESMFRPTVARRMRAMRKESQELMESRRILEPIEHRNFAGVITPSNWPVTGRLFFRAVGGRYGDHRNWAAIDGWAEQIASSLQPEERCRSRQNEGA